MSSFVAVQSPSAQCGTGIRIEKCRWLHLQHRQLVFQSPILTRYLTVAIVDSKFAHGRCRMAA